MRCDVGLLLEEQARCQPLVDPADALYALRAVEAVDKSIRAKGPVAFEG